jgi:hypothetical protein
MTGRHGGGAQSIEFFLGGGVFRASASLPHLVRSLTFTPVESPRQPDQTVAKAGGVSGARDRTTRSRSSAPNWSQRGCDRSRYLNLTGHGAFMRFKR